MAARGPMTAPAIQVLLSLSLPLPLPVEDEVEAEVGVDVLLLVDDAVFVVLEMFTALLARVASLQPLRM